MTGTRIPYTTERPQAGTSLTHPKAPCQHTLTYTVLVRPPPPGPFSDPNMSTNDDAASPQKGPPRRVRTVLPSRVPTARCLPLLLDLGSILASRERARDGVEAREQRLARLARNVVLVVDLLGLGRRPLDRLRGLLHHLVLLVEVLGLLHRPLCSRCGLGGDLVLLVRLLGLAYQVVGVLSNLPRNIPLLPSRRREVGRACRPGGAEKHGSPYYSCPQRHACCSTCQRGASHHLDAARPRGSLLGSGDSIGASLDSFGVFRGQLHRLHGSLGLLVAHFSWIGGVGGVCI
mmetsp:Transcript_38041/g.88824  ORF Transcript_38041/g.88824 Transcript_38041/m.88824 type:complete len:289 (-) Transcript_38041:45-911(-)